ncbi:hypothetical protein Kpol_1007p2 [Vanderwaltozyma polyspora DSM 70294]|uniref:DNA-(apurinic or apyrimidinic site) endonuclease 2 n=1 Tax=Vanderwaltozyma polyspora (strain ATCC 22028 / DSM 70294 / BCRC 21397 / CBS 2163 / NBRC 10782 / NRRL Y-8283 / UCD 57-17) TaxID=436907 RepID=A7TRS4_VANPO|nr:uncharacterized protein Kpol_1007p2 [Vanderwaltozyma polyspora DSM 70294]EDO15018.1 hypothetical protein Kpol_1007p2 [Vanderwaltozyma polyspora DSM 70294]
MSGISVVDRKQGSDAIRFVSFNVNGVRTLFHYQPFSQMNQSLKASFEYFDADVITFQELKTEKYGISKWGKVDDFYSFISIPSNKKGYSGVGCWVRKPEKDHPLYEALKVVKAEEGITGYLTVKVGGKEVRYKDDTSQGIGGYESLGLDETNDDEALTLDSEGRCVVVELACNIVVFNVYCPANSGQTDDGQLFRLKYLKVLYKRIRNLKALGKNIVLMGDINSCRDLIDQAEALEANMIQITSTTTGEDIEEKYSQLAYEFVMNPEAPQRRMLNQMLTDSIIPGISQDGILVDTTRYVQTKKRLKMYTVWNTLKNTRPVNYGSRIDFILLSKELQDYILQADILPDVMGSDHCPVYLDIDSNFFTKGNDYDQVKVPRFEAKFKYDLNHKNILDMFGSQNRKRQLPSNDPEDGSAGSSSTFKKSTSSRMVKGSTTSEVHDELLIKGTNIKQTGDCISERNVKKVSTSQTKLSFFNDRLPKAPLCKHGIEAILKTSKTPTNYGRRFWSCEKPNGDSGNKAGSCGFFQWVS